MCGFGGFWEGRGQTAPERSRAILSEMGRRIAHRGPDDEKIILEKNLGLVFRRLSIVDLNSGWQPIWNENSTICVVVNGEIYNHKELRGRLRQDHVFRTQSDSEIVVHLYEEFGRDAIQFLSGKFALAIYDRTLQKVTLARDRMGVKPLYYWRRPGLVVFGSETKAVLAHPEVPREVEWEAFTESSFSFLPQTTFVSGIEQLRGGQIAEIGMGGSFEISTYWKLEDFLEKSASELKSPEDYVAKYRELFGQAVRRRLMSDVPVGAFLSGGLDSSMMVAAAKKMGMDLESYTILERGTVKCGDVGAARTLSRTLQVRLHEVLFDYRTFLDEIDFSLAYFEYMVALMDRPQFQLEWVMKHELHRYVKTQNSANKVILLGQGSDEFSGGYSNTDRREWKRTSWQDFLKKSILPLLAGRELRGRRVPSEVERFLGLESLASRVGPSTSLYHNEMFWAWERLQAYNLWHEDRTSSSQGVEARVPFLDSDLVEFLVGVPASLHGELFWDKTIVRKAALAWLPSELAFRKKIGFIYGPDRGSADILYRKVLERIFPAFCEKYLAGSEYRVDRIQAEVAAALHSNSPNSWVRDVLNFFAGVIFREQIRSGLGPYVSEHYRPPCALRSQPGVDENYWPDESQDETRELQLHLLNEGDGLKFVVDPTLEVRLLPPSKIEFLRGGRVIDTLRPTESDRKLFSFLLDRQIDPGKPSFTVQLLSESCGLSRMDAIALATYLFQKGLILKQT